MGTKPYTAYTPVPLLQIVTVRVSDRGCLTERKYLLAEGERVSVTVAVEPTDDGLVCLPLGDIPRLFLGFPLVGTETFSFPSVHEPLCPRVGGVKLDPLPAAQVIHSTSELRNSLRDRILARIGEGPNLIQ